MWKTSSKVSDQAVRNPADVFGIVSEINSLSESTNSGTSLAALRGMRRLLFFSAWACLAFACAIEAAPIGPNCGTCQGSIYSLTYSGSPIATTGNSETFRITFTIDTSGYNGGGTNINTVALKVSSSFLDAELVSAPDGVASWVEMFGGLNAAGCSGSGSGYDCVRVANFADAPLVPGGTYVWVFDIEVPTGDLFTGEGQASVKARYGDEFSAKVGALVSEGITLGVPEPLLGSLLAIGGKLAVWRRRTR
jgi:hypothetical protein